MTPPPTTTTCARAGRVASATGELAIRHPVRPRRLGAQPVDLVLLIGLEVSFEPEPVRPALPGQDVRRYPVEEPPVVAGDNGAAREFEQRVLQRRERLDIEV